MRGKASGLTLIELLVAMALIGIIFALVTNWQTSTLAISTRTNAMSQRISNLNDVTGYVGDRVRSAVRVRVATSGLTINTAAPNTCSTGNPCLIVVLPTVNASGQISGYNTYLYRIEPRSFVSPEDKMSDSWAESNTVVLREYRSTATSTPADCTDTTSSTCTTLLSNAVTLGAFSGFQPYLVADYLTPAGSLGSGAAPFAYNSTSKIVTLAFQSKQQVRNSVEYTPTDGPYTLQVQARNVP